MWNNFTAIKIYSHSSILSTARSWRARACPSIQLCIDISNLISLQSCHPGHGILIRKSIHTWTAHNVLYSSNGQILLSKAGELRTNPQEKYIYSFFLITKARNGERDLILNWRSISTGLPSRNCVASCIFKALCFPTVEMPWRLQWPLSPYDSTAFRDAWDGSHDEE